jgi:hypothetical protein
MGADVNKNEFIVCIYYALKNTGIVLLAIAIYSTIFIPYCPLNSVVS